MPTSPSPFSSSERALARVGTVIQQYRIDRLIGLGGMAAVYAATHRDGQRVAIKFMLERFRDNVEASHFFDRETLIANQVGHPGAVPVLAHDIDDGCGFLVMPLLEGETLRSRWERMNRRLSVSETGVLMSDVLDVLASAHEKGIVHRDIKLENLFLTSTGEVRVLDFGIARRIDRDGSATMTGAIVGTPAFMPPEQALGDRQAVGPHSDCWAAGATMFTLLSGEFVHAAESAQMHLAAASKRARSLADVAPNLPLSIVQLVDKALAFDPMSRWPSGRAMHNALRTAFEEAVGEPIGHVATQLRAELIEDWSRHSTETTGVKKTQSPDDESHPAGHRYEGPSVHPASLWQPPVMDLSRLDLSGVETAVRDLTPALHLFRQRDYELYAENGFGRFTEDGKFVLEQGPWEPTARYAKLCYQIAASLGPNRTFEVVKLLHRYATMIPMDPLGEDIHRAFALYDIRFHMTHRKNGEPMYDPASEHMLEGIGHIRYRGEPGVNFISLECDTYTPCDMHRGAHFALARRYEPHSLVEHAPGSCRKKGDASCTYHITWW